MAIVDREQKEFKGNREHLAVLLDALEKDDVKIWNEWRMNGPCVLPDLRGANLAGAKMQEIDFNGTDLEGANLTKANLTQAELSGVVLSRANLVETRFIHASIYGGALREADLTNAIFKGAALNGADLSGATLTGARIHGIANADWIVEGIKCDYVYIDTLEKKRRPEDRDFEPDEFERLYKQYPTIDLDFKDNFDALSILITDYATVELNKEHGEYDFKIKEISSYGACPVIKVSVNSKEQIKEGKAVLIERIAQVEKQLEDSKLTISSLHNLIGLAIKNGPKNQINVNDGATIIGPVLAGDGAIQTISYLVQQIEEIKKKVDASGLSEGDKSITKKLLDEFKKCGTSEAKRRLAEWTKKLADKGIESIPAMLEMILKSF